MPGIAVDLSHCATKSKVFGYTGDDLPKALDGCQVHNLELRCYTKFMIHILYLCGLSCFIPRIGIVISDDKYNRWY